ncbi:MAG: hypothetical protein KIT56_07635 [Gammaproteobacteria bacterium]|nr:hypothetical protein [Gammaproteobacteria bacterium]MCW5583731.1 hypothetical protein [Gammaproteobacteria bacterium]
MHHKHHSPRQFSSHQEKNKYNLDVLEQQRKQQEHQTNIRTHAKLRTLLEGETKHRRRKIVHKPPAVLKREKLEESVFIATINYLLPFFGSLSKKQMIALCFFAMIAGRYVIEASEKVNDKIGKQSRKQRPLKEKEALKAKVYHDICTETAFITTNKPNITLGSKEGVLIPKVCVTGKMTNECLFNQHVLASFVPDFRILSKMREDFRKTNGNWMISSSDTIYKIMDMQSKEQNLAYMGIMDVIAKLRQAYTKANLIQQSKEGNCDEHTAYAFTTLMQKKLQYGLEMKIQVVEVHASQSTRFIQDHTYLLIDSDIEDVEARGIKEVNAVFDKITKGNICDPWNRGYYADFKTDDSGLYKSEAGWDFLSLKTYSLKFKEFKQLSVDAQRFICHELQGIGFDVEPKEACRMFKKPVKTEQPAATGQEKGYALKDML